MPTQLTPEEIERISADAVKIFPQIENIQVESWTPMFRERSAYVQGVIRATMAERLKAKALLEALEKISQMPSSIGMSYEMRITAIEAINNYNSQPKP